jgi:hypothetical protein
MGLKTLIGFGPKIKNSVDRNPDGLLLHENLIYSLIPLHLGMRQYWRDFDSLEAWTRSTPHRDWWRRLPMHSKPIRRQYLGRLWPRAAGGSRPSRSDR